MDTKIHQHLCKNQPSGTPNPSEMVRRNAFNVIMGKGPLQDPPGGGAYWRVQRLLGTAWLILSAIWDPSWAPRGSQNQAFWHQDARKLRKLTSRRRHDKKYGFFIVFLTENTLFMILFSEESVGSRFRAVLPNLAWLIKIKTNSMCIVQP